MSGSGKPSGENPPILGCILFAITFFFASVAGAALGVKLFLWIVS